MSDWAAHKNFAIESNPRFSMANNIYLKSLGCQ
jgi:hypothetical protein